MKNTKIRQSNFELMRIISMLYIVIWHFFVHGGIWGGTNGITKDIVTLMCALLLVHVNSFVLLTGYFSYDKPFRLSKVIKINNSMWFYRVACLLIFVFGFSYNFTKLEIFKMVSPLPRLADYWFLLVYILLLLVSPVLNVVIKNSNKEKHKKIIIVLLVISFLSYITNSEFVNIAGGYSLFSFILLYFVGAYLHKYPIDKSNIFKSFSKNKIKLIALLLYVGLSIINMLLYMYGKSIETNPNSVVYYYSSVITSGFVCYSNIITIFASIFYFIFFSEIEIKSRVINFFSKNILGVYLITENLLVRKVMYGYLGFGEKQYTDKNVLIAIGLSIGILIICTLIETIRSLIFKFFYNRKVSGKLRNKIQNYLSSLDINVNW